MNTAFKAIALLAIVLFAQTASAQQGVRLYKGSAEYGWSHSGVSSWGGGWQKHAQNKALDQIQRKIASMVNLAQLNTFTRTDNNKKLKAAGAYDSLTESGSVRIAYAKSMSSAQQLSWINRNNYLIVVRNVRVKRGTDFTKTTNSGFPHFKNSWIASATMIYDYEIYGPAPKSSREVIVRIRLGSGYNDYKSYYINGKRFTCEKGRIRTHERTVYVSGGQAPTVKIEFDARLGSGKSFKSYRLKSGTYEFVRNGNTADLRFVR